MKFITLEEVIAFAVEREDTAYQLYKRAEELSTSIAAKKMFAELADEEATHKEVFSKISQEKAEHAKVCTLPESSIAKYLTNVPFRPDMTYSEILTYALKTEENAFQLYKAAAGMTDDEKLQKVLMNFANVELGHRRRLEAIYEDRVLTEG
ncbi:ferritin family protein [Pelotalea chapellei]|uniref:Ferritin family protein n=1 Tax=Pelotalea chapellei TaxID=44671 RepID=A0ABS5U6P3_9BACT|nr:ferritin family protein [Pelotalea chapellei]MBT1071330.1 ferritin family protein [Pelotalea chapellei]